MSAFRIFRFLLTVLVASFVTTFWGTLLITFGRLERLTWARGKHVGWFGVRAKAWWAWWMAKGLGLRVQLGGPYAHRLSELPGSILVSNHQSLLDILAIITVLPGYFHFIAKKELRAIPFFGGGAAAVGVVFIDRKKGAQNESLKDAEAAVKQGHSLILFPEGTRSRDGKLLPFKRGAFVMAISLKAPVVPIVISGSRELCPKGSLVVMQGLIRVWIGEPISTEGLTLENRHQLSEQVHTIISKQLESFA